MIYRRHSSTPEFLFMGTTPITKGVSGGNAVPNCSCSRNNLCRIISLRQCPSFRRTGRLSYFAALCLRGKKRVAPKNQIMTGNWHEAFARLKTEVVERRRSFRLQGLIGKELAATTGCPPGGEGGGQRIKKKGDHSELNLRFIGEQCRLRSTQKNRVSEELKRGLGGMG